MAVASRRPQGRVHERFTFGNDPEEMGAQLPALSLGVGLSGARIVGGEAHRCALFSEGQVKCWGSGAMGQLGLETSETIGDDPAELGEALNFVSLGH